jgi:pyrrolidone-carboxylate peptidase
MDAMGANDTPDAAATGVLLDAPRTALSTNAGGYYCGHVFFVLQRRARLSRTAAGQVRAGFLHVPREPNGSERRPAPERFAALRRVLDGASIERAVAAHEATAVIALGVARSREDFTVESVPDDSGLEHEGALRHAGGRAIRCRGPASSWLADCVRRGARR